MPDDPTDTPPSPFGAWLRDQRHALRVTVAVAAQRAGLSKSYWTDLESGYTWGKAGKLPVKPRVEQAVAACRAVEADIMVGMRLAAGLTVNLDTEPVMLTSRDLTAVITDLHPDDQATVQVLVERLAEPPDPGDVPEPADDPDSEGWVFGAQLRAARRALGLSRDEAARKAGLSGSWWQALESGVAWGTGVGSRPVNASAAVIASAARVVGIDKREAFLAAGLTADADALGADYRSVSTPVLASMIVGMPAPLRLAVQTVIQHLGDQVR